MSIAVICNLSDGVILGADSAITVTSSHAQLGSLVAKVYNKADKVFPLSDLPIGVTNFGVAMMEGRSIGSYIEEFEATVIEKNDDSRKEFQDMKLTDVATKLGKFFYNKYKFSIEDRIKPKHTEKKGAEENVGMPVLGLVVAGYSPEAYLAEVIDVSMPSVLPDNAPRLIRKEGNFGTNWFGNYMPITVLIKQMNPMIIEEVIGYFVKERGVSFSDDDKSKIEKILGKYENKIPYAAMPLKEGIEHVKFLLDTVIGMTKWVVGAPICGGPTRVGIVKRNKKLVYTE